MLLPHQVTDVFNVAGDEVVEADHRVTHLQETIA
jgi:hypothetical protein